MMGTNSSMGKVLLDSLIDADLSPDRMTMLECDDSVVRDYRLRHSDHRWQEKAMVFGDSGKDVFRADLEWATAIINVPFLKTHHLATMTCCLKNLSHGLIRHPSRFHEGGCDPAIAEIVAHPQIRNRLKLNIVNGLRVVFDRGAEASERDFASEGLLLVSEDPVATDMVGFATLNKIRAERGLGPLLPAPQRPKYLDTAGRIGLGVNDLERIKQIVVDE